MSYENRLEILKAVENGKLDVDEAVSLISKISTSNSTDNISNKILLIISKLINMNPDEIDIDADFSKYGFDSVTFIELADNVNNIFKTELTPAVFFEYSTINSLIEYLSENYREITSTSNKSNVKNDERSKLDKLKKIVATSINLSPSEIDVNSDFSKYGFDSVTFIELADNINNDFGIDLTPAIFFEYSTTDSLLNYLIKEYNIETEKNISSINNDSKKPTLSSTTSQLSTRFHINKDNQIKKREPIAIIGVDGIFPQSDNLQAFWSNLEQQKDLIVEIPKNRWDWKDFYGDPRQDANVTLSKWGGFINDYDKFDAAFFGISPREAELMDPQQRLFLQVCWKAIENAGYKVSSLSGTSTGVFVGIGSNDYFSLLAGNSVQLDAFVSTGASHSLASNRVSYLLNISGPSEPIDTACSSSLVAIHRAVEAIHNGECEMALAGGVNVLSSPLFYITLNKAGMLSPDGRCKTFDKKANGYVRGEGAGAIFLKPLSKAEADNDYIYAVIKGSAENHGGKAKSLTAPNPNAQAELLKKAYKKANISPETVTYIEAHGTGTSLGDPIEINGLKKAFSELNTNHSQKALSKSYCAISSVKTNIGHLEMAAGIAGVIKVLLAMKNKKIPGIVHFNELNPYIKLDDSPFYIAKKTEEWKHLKDKNGNEIPYRAGISSFGFGGSNSHIVLEEYKNSEVKDNTKDSSYAIIPLSTKTSKQLKEYALDLYQFINHNKKNYSLHQVANILQSGRDEYNERLAIVTNSFDDLLKLLKQYNEETIKSPNIIYGSVDKRINSENILDANTLKSEEEHLKAASYWIKGGSIKWLSLSKKSILQKAPLPTYPFEKRSFWLKGINFNLLKGDICKEDSKKLHPLLSSNISTLKEQMFTTVFKGDEFFLKDHIINDKKVLPGVGYLEMARKAGEISGNKKVTSITNIIWTIPIIVSQGHFSSNIVLAPQKNLVAYKIFSNDNNSKHVIHSQGKLNFETLITKPEKLNIKELNSRCQNEISGKDCYNLFASKGFHYGQSFQAIKQIKYNSKESISTLKLPEHMEKSKDDFILHPSIMDAALQSTIMLINNNESDSSKVYLPYSLQKIDIFESPTNACYAYAYLSDSSNGKKSYDITLLDDSGQVLIHFNEFTVKAQQQNVNNNPRKRNKSLSLPANVVYYKNNWIESKLKADKSIEGSILIFENKTSIYSKLIEEGISKDKLINIKQGNSFKKIDNNSYEVAPLELQSYKELLNALNNDSITVNNILYFQSEELFNSAKLNKQLDNSINPLFFISKALIQVKLKNKVHLSYIYPESKDIKNPVYYGVTGFAKTMSQENPKYNFKTIGVDNNSSDYLKKIALDEVMAKDEAIEIKYANSKRYIKVISQVKSPTPWPDEITIKENGNYLITGGLGGLGLIFSEYITNKHKVNLFLTGRSKLTDNKKEQIKTLESKGSKIYYIESDITQKSDITNLFKTIKEKVEKLDGILHCAGVLRDSFLTQKSWDDFKTVLAPKVPGTTYLDEEFKESPLDFFILFSSVAAVTGNSGQSDYAYANSFMDHFTEYRNNLVKKGKRSGKTISINWPLWDSEGMNVDEKTKQFLFNKTGMLPLEPVNGVKAFEDSLQLQIPQLIVFQGDVQKLNNFLKVIEVQTENNDTINTNKVSSSSNNNTEKNKIISELQDIFAKVLKVDATDIDNDLEFSDYGIDSIVIMDIMNEIETRYNETVEPNIFSEYNTLTQLADYLFENFSISIPKEIEAPLASSIDNKANIKDTLIKVFAKLLKVSTDEVDPAIEFSDYGVDSIIMMDIINEIEKKYGETLEPSILTEHPTINLLSSYLVESNIANPGIAKPHSLEETKSVLAEEYENDSIYNSRFFVDSQVTSTFNEKPSSNKVAIIGMACNLPQSDNLESFWNNLKGKKDLVTEVPKDRWEIEKYYDQNKSTPGKSYSKWAGFIDNIDLFDAKFFNVNDDDALVMDPQQRIILELSQKLLDNAGFKKNELSNTNTAVYLGTAASNYLHNNMQAISSKHQKHMILNSIQNMTAARISDFYNLTGNSHTIDTACSSSLVAIHQACHSILTGECSMAIAGGVELLLDEVLHIGFSKSGALSDGPHSYVFDERAKGFVLGEGAGLVLLKAYEQAIADGDRILGIILGSAVNNDGHTMGLTVPSQDGQKAVIQQAINKSGITPDTISYLEAHGTGTLLGDPIEIKAAGQVYSKYSNEKQYCAVGAVKSNMGHALHAAGVAGLIKILLSMEHKYIPPTLHCEKPHPRFQFEKSPFYPVLKGQKWTPHKGVRRAAISSFGFGGTNAHLILEEAPEKYNSKRQELPSTQFKHKRYWLGEKKTGDKTSKKVFSYDELLIQLHNGEITPDELIKLEESGQVIKS